MKLFKVLLKTPHTRGKKKHKNREQQNRTDTINNTATLVYQQWLTAFGSNENLLISLRTVKRQIHSYIDDYTDCVSSKKSSERKALKTWREKNHILFDLLRDSVLVNELGPDEQTFYQQQRDPENRRAYISHSVDSEYEESVQNQAMELFENEPVVSNALNSPLYNISGVGKGVSNRMTRTLLNK